MAGAKKQEAQQQIQLNQAMMDLMNKYSAQTNPFWSSRLSGGLPFFNQLTDYSSGTLAKSFAPQFAALNRRLSGFGDTLPSGFKEQQLTNLGAQEGEMFDENMVRNLSANEQSKLQAAASLNPFQPAQIGSGAAGSVLSAPAVNSGGFGNFLGGAVSGLLNNVSYSKGGLTI